MSSHRVHTALIAAAIAAAGLAAAPAATALSLKETTCDAIMWTGDDGSTSHIYTANDNGADRLLVSGLVGFDIPIDNNDAAWSPDGTKILWRGSNADNSKIYVVAADGLDPIEISATEDEADPPLDNTEAVWSPNGTKIAWRGHTSTKQIFVANADGTERVEISTVDDNTDDPTNNTAPTWSPDGTKVMWQGNDGTGLQIHVANADGTDRRSISAVSDETDDPTNNTAPTWSPDGTKVMWTGTANGTTHVYVANPDGTDRTTVSIADVEANPTINSDPTWSPDSARIAWRGYNGSDFHIFTANADGTNRNEVSSLDLGAKTPRANQRPNWSPDSTKIAWDGKIKGTRLVFVANPDGTERNPISSANMGNGQTKDAQHATWSPDGTKIAWQSIDASAQVQVANADGSEPVQASTFDNLTPAPIDSYAPVQWRPRSGQVEIAAIFDELVAGHRASITVTASAECPIGDVELSGLAFPCLAQATTTVTVGELSEDGVWSIGDLHGTQSATFTGVVDGPDCEAEIHVINSVPTQVTSSGVTVGDRAKPACPTTHPFTDIGDLRYGEDDIACIYNLGITTGTSETTYSPHHNVTRQQIAAFLARTWRVLGGTCDDTTHPFTDIGDLRYGEDDIACIYNLGITTGTSETTYSPHHNVTRQQMGAFLARTWRALGATCDSTTHPFTDIGDLRYGEDDIACIYNLGITTGTSETTYSPHHNVTRQQMGAFLARTWRTAIEAGF